MNNLHIAVVVTALNTGLFLASAVHAGSTSAEGAAPLLRGRALELVDERGRLRARLNVEPGGAAVFRLLDDHGTIRVKLGADQDGSGLLLANDATEPGIHLLAKGTGSSMKVANKDGRATIIAP